MFSSPRVVTQKDCLSYFIWALKVSLRLTLIQKRDLCSLRGLPLMTEFSVFMSLQGTRKHPPRKRFFERLQNLMENENKIILGDFNCTMDNMNRLGGKETQRLSIYYSDYGLLKSIVDNGLEYLWRRESPDFLEFKRYERSFGKDPG